MTKNDLFLGSQFSQKVDFSEIFSPAWARARPGPLKRRLWGGPMGLAHGSWPMGLGPWAKAHGPRPMGQAHGPAPKSSLQGPGPGPGPSRRKNFRKIDFLGKLRPQKKVIFGHFCPSVPMSIFFVRAYPPFCIPPFSPSSRWLGC